MVTVCEKCGQGYASHSGQAGEVCPVAVGSSTDPDHYRSTLGVNVELQPSVWLALPMLQFLCGQPWDKVALSCVTALRPSQIRVTRGEVTCDARDWRVTVYLADDDRTIRCIEQEVAAWGCEGVYCGHDLDMLIRKIQP